MILSLATPNQSSRYTNGDIRLPNELIYKILVALLASSILDICTLGMHTPLWDKHVVVTLATTCYNWHEITKDILSKAFRNKLSKGGGSFDRKISIFCETRMMLSSLNTIGTQLHHRPSSPSALSINSPLTRTYSLYLTSVALRRHASQSQDLLKKTRPTLRAALECSLDACDRVRPMGLVDTVRERIQWELWVTEVDCSLAEARASLECAAEAICLVEPHDNAETERHEIKTRMDNALSLAESVLPIPCDLWSFGKTLEQVQRSINASGIISTLTKYYSGKLDFGLDEYDLRRRAWEYNLKGRGDSLLEWDKLLCGLPSR